MSALLDDPMAPLAGGGLLAVLLGYGAYRVVQRRRNAQTADSSFFESRLQPDSFFDASGGQRVDTASTDSTTGSSSMAYTPSQLDAGGDVDPVAAVAKGEIFNFLTDVERVTKEADVHLTEIMMAQDFHDLTGQVIARVVNLAATIEDQLVQLLIQTAPPNAHVPVAAPEPVRLQGPVVDPENTPDIVTDQSQVDDLLASLGF